MDELVAACQRGDRDAFGRLFDLHRDRVFRIALGIAGDRDRAADITQDVFMKLLTRLAQFDARSAFTTWLYRIVVTTAIDARRASGRIEPLDDGVAGEARVDDEYARKEQRAHVEHAIRRLPTALRAPLVLRHFADLSYAEIAATLDVPLGTVSSRLSRAYAAVARALEDHT